MLLTGYIEKHKDLCNEDDCPLKVPLASEDPEEKVACLLRQVNRMFEAGLKKFPS